MQGALHSGLLHTSGEPSVEAVDEHANTSMPLSAPCMAMDCPPYGQVPFRTSTLDDPEADPLLDETDWCDDCDAPDRDAAPSHGYGAAGTGDLPRGQNVLNFLK